VLTTAKLSSSGCGIADTSVGPASVMVGNLVQGNRLAVAQGRDIGIAEDTERKVNIILITFFSKICFFIYLTCKYREPWKLLHNLT